MNARTGRPIASKRAGIFLVFACTSVLAAGCAADRGAAPAAAETAGLTTPVCASPAAFPSGFGWPQAAATVQGWVRERNEAAIRAHGWNLWAGLNAAHLGGPVWRTWCTSSQAFRFDAGAGAVGAAAPGPSGHAQLGLLPLQALRQARGLETGEDPINFPHSPGYALPAQVRADYPQCVNPPKSAGQFATLKDGWTYQSNGDVMIAGVVYNQPAYDWIRGQQLYLASTLDAQRKPNQVRHMAAMPDRSIVLKPMLWPVPATGYSALPLWDDRTDDHGRYAGFEIQSMWPRAVAVTAQPQSQIARTDVRFLHGVHQRDDVNSPALGPLLYRDAAVAGIDRFYHFRPDLRGLAPCDRALLDASAHWAYGRPFRQGDMLALVAMHVMTKEQPAWTFQSVWWHDRPDEGPYAAGRPPIPPSRAPGPWRHYLMASTYGTPSRTDPSRWPVAYNPYIELAAAHPIRTNCMNCHHRAAWPAQADGYEATGGPDALQIFAMDNPAIFDGLLGVDSLWSIADRAGPPQHPPGRAGAPAPARR